MMRVVGMPMDCCVQYVFMSIWVDCAKPLNQQGRRGETHDMRLMLAPYAIGKLVHGVDLAHVEWCVAHGAAMRQLGDEIWTHTAQTDPEGCQTIHNQYPENTSYPNQVMYFSWPIGNYRPYVLLRTSIPNNMLISWSYSYNSNNKWKILVYPSAVVVQPVFLSTEKNSIFVHIISIFHNDDLLVPITNRSIFEHPQHLLFKSVVDHGARIDNYYDFSLCAPRDRESIIMLVAVTFFVSHILEYSGYVRSDEDRLVIT